MKRRAGSSKRQTATRRRWHVTPPLIHGNETLEGGAILNEWPNPLGVILWQAFRDVMLWSMTDPAKRGEVFAPGSRHSDSALPDSETDPRLTGGLKLIRKLVEAPLSVREDQVARACRGLSEWACDRGRLHTALAFAQDAALANRSSAASAFWVATLAGRLNDHARAEGWFRRAIGLARQSRDWRMYSRSFSGLGNLYIRRGNLPAARRLHTRALRGARRGGMRREQAAALHDLFIVSAETGNVWEAERLARQALEAFGTRNRRIYALAHDVAYFWMEQGHFGRALPVFQAVLPLLENRLERVLVLANVVRAAGGVGDAETADEAARQVYESLAQPELRSGTGRALLEVAKGYLSLGRLDQAERAASSSLAAAIEFRESKIQFAAEAVLASVRGNVAAAPTPVRRAPVTVPIDEELPGEFVRKLETVAGAAS